MEQKEIKSFFDLLAWQKGHQFVLMLYRAMERFPADEKFGLVSQMKRASVSITSNIAEGFSRYGSADKINFYRFSKGSITEIQNQLVISKDLKYINEKEFKELFEQLTVVQKLVSGLIGGIKVRGDKKK